MGETIAIIPARSGSKGLLNKNILPYLSKPLLVHSIEYAINNNCIDKVLISTDSEEYENIAIENGADSNGLRPEYISNDLAKTIDVIKHELKELKTKGEEFEFLVLLQPTSPLRESSDLNQIFEIFSNSNANSVVSVNKIEEPHPMKMKKISETGELISFIDNSNSEIPRQQLPDAYQLTGTYYVGKISEILKQNSLQPSPCYPFFMDKFINIDTKSDYINLINK